jgi:hypothetical protein
MQSGSLNLLEPSGPVKGCNGIALPLTEDMRKRDDLENRDGRSTSSHDSEKYRTRSMEKQGGMAFGYWKTATAVIEQDRYIDRH